MAVYGIAMHWISWNVSSNIGIAIRGKVDVRQQVAMEAMQFSWQRAAAEHWRKSELGTLHWWLIWAGREAVLALIFPIFWA